MREKIRAGLDEASKYYDDSVFSERGFENPVAFKKKIVKIILSYDKRLQYKKLLDAGCGNGNFLEYAERFFETYGIDFSKNAINIAKKRCKKSKLFVSPAEKLRFKHGCFDIIVCLGSLEHFVDMNKALSEMVRVLKEKGIAIIHVPNSYYLIHMMLGIHDHGQINWRMGTESEWTAILSKYMKVLKCYKWNTHWYLKWIPRRYCCHFTFLCENCR